MMNLLLWSVILSCLYVVVTAEEHVEQVGDRNSKLSIFQVVKFANSECSGGSGGSGARNGTCFTKAECTAVGGSSSGNCADGFGVCCIVTISTGQSASVNNSYLTLTSDITAGSHQYTVCPCSDDICRIKFDFIAFSLEGPFSGSGTKVGGGAEDTVAEAASYVNIGACGTDTFQIRTPSGRSSPLICGENANQHMIIDACGSECLTVDVGIGGTSTSTRKFDIRVMQYRCGDEQGGPPGCLQYYQNSSGKIRSFNFPDAAGGTAITHDYAIHLNNQHYKTCIRRANGMEVICYVPCTQNDGNDGGAAGEDVTNQPSFGLSITTSATEALAQTDTSCLTDYITIIFGNDSAEYTTANAHQDSVIDSSTYSTRYCGRHFHTNNNNAYADISVCSHAVPFEIAVDFDDTEICTTNTTPLVCEAKVLAIGDGGAGGILGFSLCYDQKTVPIA